MKKFKGLYTALITPFTESNQLDEEGLRFLIQRQVKANIDGVVLIGSTGESPTLSEAEKKRMIAIGKEETEGTPCQLIIGTGSNCTAETIKETQYAGESGADGALVVVPYYNRPSQEGLYLHYRAIANYSSIPLIIYNVPGRTGVNLQVETLLRLAQLPTIVSLKDCSGSVTQVSEAIIGTKQINPHFSILSGDDAMTLALMALGGDGLISVASNLFPTEMKALVSAASQDDFLTARKHHNQLMELFEVLFIETNPTPIKQAMALCGLPTGKCRLPLAPLSAENNKKLTQVIEGLRK